MIGFRGKSETRLIKNSVLRGAVFLPDILMLLLFNAYFRFRHAAGEPLPFNLIGRFLKSRGVRIDFPAGSDYTDIRDCFPFAY